MRSARCFIFDEPHVGTLVQSEVPEERRILYQGREVPGHSLRVTFPRSLHRSRRHLQVCGPVIDRIMLNGQCTDNEVQICCPCPASMVRSLRLRHNVGAGGCPSRMNRRTHLGFWRALCVIADALIEQARHVPLPSRAQILKTYVGQRVKYNAHAAMLAELKTYGCPKPSECYMKGAVKTGEKQQRDPADDPKPRALLVHCTRARGGAVYRDSSGNKRMTKPGQELIATILEAPVRRWHEAGLEKLLNFDGTRMVASGMSLAQRARAIIKMFDPGYVCLSFDLSNFDGSQELKGALERRCTVQTLLKLGYESEAGFYKELFKSFDFIRVEADGVKAELFGNRASGTAGTSAGNKIVMLAILVYALRGCEFKKFLCDGDDTLVFVPEMEYRLHLNSWLRRMRRCRVQPKLENVAYSWEDVVFCRARIVVTAGGPVLVKDPYDAFRGQTNFDRHLSPRFLDYLTTLADGFRNSYSGVPVLGEMHEMFLRGGVHDATTLASSGIEYVFRTDSRLRAIPITDSARSSFARAFGIQPDEQRLWERRFVEIRESLADSVSRAGGVEIPSVGFIPNRRTRPGLATPAAGVT